MLCHRPSVWNSLSDNVRQPILSSVSVSKNVYVGVNWRIEKYDAVASICRKMWESGSVTLGHQIFFKLHPIRQWFANSETIIGKIYGSVIFLNSPGSWQTVDASILDDMKFAELSNNSFEWKDVTF